MDWLPPINVTSLSWEPTPPDELKRWQEQLRRYLALRGYSSIPLEEQADDPIIVEQEGER